MQVIGKELFGRLRETHGKGFQSFIEEKVIPLAGDIIHENLGVEEPQLSQMTQELNVIVNGAATTNFYERYVFTFTLRILLLTRYVRVYGIYSFHMENWVVVNALF
jgi:fatty acyl-CoA reductase